MSVIWSGVTEGGAIVPVQVTAEGKVVAVGDGPEGDYLKLTGGNLTGDLTLGTDKITLATAGGASFAGDVKIGDDVSGPTAYNRNGILLTSAGDAVLCNSEATTDGATALTLANRQTSLSTGHNTQIKFELTNSGGAVSNAYFRVTASNAVGVGGAVVDIGNRTSSATSTSTALRIDEFQRVRLNSTLSNTNAGSLYLENPKAEFKLFGTGGGDPKISMNPDGSAIFDGDVVIGSRGEQWLIRESNGVAMLVKQSLRQPGEEKLRDLPNELDLIEAALNEIMEKLRMTPPAGWPVWDGQ